ncbi:MAG: LVIVD repeat-containing protein [candidate division WOR-3 bacterium]|jgi:hypothetical protein
MKQLLCLSVRALFSASLLLLLVTCIKPLPAPAPVQLLYPINDTTVNSAEITFNWQSAERVMKYVIQVSADAKFRSFAVEETVYQNWTTCRLQTDGRYWWRVRVQSEQGVWGEWTQPAGFTLKRFTIINSVKTQGYPHDLTIQANYIFIADGQAGLAVYDISNPENPVLTAQIMDSLNVAWGVDVRDTLAFLAYGYKELMIVNVARPESLKTIGVLEYPQPGYGYDVALKDSWAYIAAGAQFIAVNITDPRYPNLRFQYYYPRNCRSLTVDNGNCYVACEQLGIAGWRLDTFPPIPAGSFDTPGNARGVASAEGVVMIADGRNGLIIADGSEPAVIRQLSSISLAGYASSVTIDDTLVFVACGSGGTAVVNWSEPSQPVLMAQIATPYAYKVGVLPGSEYLYILDRDLGIVVVRKEF